MSQSILDRLAAKHADAVFIKECAMGSRQNGCRRLDAWVLLKTWSPPTTIGYEVKNSRGDFLQDRKWQEYLPACHEFNFVCPAKLIAPEELPAEVGLLWTAGESRLITKRRAVRREPDPVTLCRLMTYVLMARSSIVGDMWETNRESKEQFWRRWLAEGAEAKKLGYEVGKKIRARLTEAEQARWDAERRLTEAEQARWDAERQRDRLEGVREKLIALGLDGNAAAYQVEDRLNGSARQLRQIARLASEISRLTETPA